MTTLAEIKRIIDRHQNGYPVEMVPLASALGIKVYRVTGWPENISGRIFRSDGSGGDSGFAIEVNATHAEVRRRFTIAHEIGHFALHQRDIGTGDGLYDDALYRSGLSNFKERQANNYASRILMPEHLLEQAMRQYGTYVPTLARAFNVSEQAMAIRLGVPQ